MNRICGGGAVLSTALALGACSAIPGYEAYRVAATGLITQTINDRMNYNDRKAEVIQALACDISVGAYSRMPDGNIKQGVAMICGINTGVNPDIAAFIMASAMMNSVNNGAPLSEVVENMQRLTQPVQQPPFVPSEQPVQ